jgi:hypothetical protein
MPSLIGARIPRLEDRPLLIGKGRFIDDINVPDMLQAGFVRSPHPHAAIRAVETAKALALPGVHAVLTLDDLAPVLSTRRMLRHSNSGTPLDRFWPSCWQLTAMSPRMPRLWSRSITMFSRRHATAALRALPVRRQFAASFAPISLLTIRSRMATLTSRSSRRRMSFMKTSGSTAAERTPSRDAASLRNGAATGA